MRVLPPEERLVPPFLCFICETHPQREQGILVVDAGFNFDPPAHTNINGRKLICSRCIEAFANLLGFRSTDQVEEALRVIEEARDHLKPLQGQIRSLAQDIERSTETLFNLPFIEQTETSKVVKDLRKKEKEENGD